MKQLGATSSVEEVAGAVSEALDAAGITAVLSEGHRQHFEEFIISLERSRGQR